MWLAICMVAAAGIAVGVVYVIARGCEPQYYWLMDSNEPPKFWVATATKKECEIEGWKRIGGPYKRPQDAPHEHPNPTNRVNNVIGPTITIRVQASTNLVDWSTVSEVRGDAEDFAYFSTNSPGFFRFQMAQ